VEQFFSIQEQPGTIEVQLVGQSNGRDVRITFDAADVVELDDDYVNEDDQEPELDTINEEEEEEETDDELPGIRFKVHISSKKDNQGLEFDCLASSHVTVESMSFLNDINDANNEENSKRYLGPDFIDLEPDLQEQFYEFLAQHHIDDDLARFIVEYADFKEQKEYLSFLEQTLKFIK
jgi:complement component 1 Q subcomponent-binding protein